MAVTLKTIAKKLNVSIMTISKALNDYPDISEETKRKVLDLAAKLNYKPNIMAKKMATKRRTNTIGVIVPELRTSFFSKIAYGIERTSAPSDYHTIVINSEDNHVNEEHEIEQLLNKRIDGFIIAPASRESGRYYEMLKRRLIPFVIVGLRFHDLECHYVLSDDETGSYEAVKYLVGLGHRRIAHLMGPKKLDTAQRRRRGYERALLDAKIEPDGGLIRGDGFYEEDGYQAMREILSLNDVPTAIFCVNDPVAIGAAGAIEEKGLHIPDDISLIGFADLPEFVTLKVPLTTVHQPAEEMGKEAAEILLEEIEFKAPIDFKQVTLDTEFIIRQSCALKR